MAAAQLVPKLVESLHPASFRYSLPVRRIGGPPELQRRDIAVVAETIQSKLVNLGRYEIGEKLARLWNRQIEQLVAIVNLVAGAFVGHPARVCGVNHPIAFGVKAPINLFSRGYFQQPIGVLG